ncbi:calcium-transporting ATPase 12, plasma membrane-type-like [Olea europaea var. sylvestris]|uniref:Calcium-transporting ATPase n=1 Tax=Olea europaea subsp. europaea TaxID=158383 RepID=A0A8S0UXD6_OLEEU|nr:calcium-transporting ATPase 12, plasma membrane-type-like [Olea europaea var. sylvestris]CAA3023726.1 calcium-transporting ATPase 12, plasma membrane-type-like [Olea europaea subsp. europaea]
MASRFRSSSDYHGSGLYRMLLDFSSATLTKPQKRWRIACIAVHFSLSLAKSMIKRTRNHKYSEISGSPSHIVLEIDSISDLNLSSSTDLVPGSFLPAVDQTKLTEMVKNKSLAELHQFDGVDGIARLLKTDMENGIPGDEDDVKKRRSAFGPNTYEKPPPKGLMYFVVEAFKDATIIILLACAVLSLAFGIREHGIQEGWYEGGSIFVAVFLVVVVSAASNFRQERQFDRLSKISSNIKIDVVRDGRRQKISVFDIVVGDVVCLKIGDQIPADGLFTDGHSFQVDESSLTGESDHVEIDSKLNPFLLSGSKVADGYSRMLVISVGMNTAWGKMMSSITQDSNEQTPLQERLIKLATSIGKVGLSVAFLVLVVMLIRYFTGNTEDENGRREYNGRRTDLNDIFNSVLQIISTAVTIVVVAIPEGLPLAVTLTLAYSMKRMMADQAMVRNLSGCETMGSATVICTDKTGTLTMNQMKVMKFWLGHENIEKDRYSQAIGPDLLELFCQGTGFNTTGSVYKPKSESVIEYSGCPTEKAILSWAVQDLGMDIEKLKQTYKIIRVETFNSEKKRSGVLIKKQVDNTYHVHWKGAAEMVLAMCTHYYQSTGEVKSISENERSQFENIIQGMAASSLRCIAFAYKQIEPEKVQCDEDDLTLLAIVGLKDPCRPGAKKAIESCRIAGVQIKMITGDNVFTAKAIAAECGILSSDQELGDGEVIEGIEFRNYTPEERILKVDNIRVMARSSPMDKLLMVKCLKQKGHVVAVTGDGTNDAPALKEADVGLSMGIQGTEVAKESSDIVILDDDFASVATVLKWGRCVYNNIQKFIQFQLTVNVAALVINFIAAVSAGEVPLTTVQLLWVNLIMDTLGALALATERPTDELMHKPPVGRTEPLITRVMWRNLLAQALYQIAILLTLQFKGKSIFNVEEKVKNTLIFNTFVLCQVFNEFNSRKLEKKNVFSGIHKNGLFLGIIGITLILQVVMVEFLKKFADTVRLNWGQWGICILLAAFTWPLGWIVKCIPVPKKPFLSYFRFFPSTS